MRIAVAQLGARRHYAVPRILHEAGRLERLFTDSYVGNKPWLQAGLAAIPGQIRPRAVDRWLGRKEPAIPPQKVTSFELISLPLLDRAGGQARRFARRGRLFNERILRHGLGTADTVWGFNGASLELFRWARRHGIRTVLEQTMAPRRSYRRLMLGELRRWPGWQPGLELPEEGDPLEAREEAEWDLADLIVCGSEFVVGELARCGGPAARCVVVPYGVDPARFRATPRQRRSPADRLKVLFVGEVGLRKGAPYLLEAGQRLGPGRLELRFAGGVALDRARLESVGSFATFLGAVPRAHMPKIYAWADLLVLPSVCEGSAAVIYEAVASGVPVLCTRSAGPPPVPGVRTVDRSETIVDLAPQLPALAHELDHSADPAVVRRFVALDAYAARLLAAIRAEPA